MARYRITSGQIHAANGVEFEVDEEATDEEIALAAADAVAEVLSYGWERIDDA